MKQSKAKQNKQIRTGQNRRKIVKEKAPNTCIDTETQICTHSNSINT